MVDRITDRTSLHRIAETIAQHLLKGISERLNAQLTSDVATSRFTLAHYERVRTCRLNDPDLDLVPEAPDGSLAACCIGWYDPAARTTEIEPLGVHPAHRRRGLAQALCHEVGRLTAERDGQEVFINNGPREAYPAPAAAYIKAGFRVIVRGRQYRLAR